MRDGDRLAVGSATVLCLAIVPVELGWIPPLRFAWGFNLWQYLPAPVAWSLAAAVALLCWPAARAALVRGVRRAWRGVESAPRAWGAALLLAAPGLFWLLRERQFFGDSNLFLIAASLGWQFALPDVGATWLLGASVRAASALGVDGRAAYQALVCASASGALLVFAALSRYLAPDPGRRALAVALVLGGGVLRVFAGHVEVYAFVLTAGGAFLWAACAHLHGRCPWPVPALALGVGIWLHPQFVFLAPALVLLLVLGAAPRAATGRVAAGAALAALPLGLFLLAMWAAGHTDDLERAWSRGLEIVGVAQTASYAGGSFLTPWWGESSAGTDYVILSPPHLKYLGNSLFVLTPAIPLLGVALARGGRRRFTDSPTTAFLTGATLCLLLYAAVTRPLWGPHDWDMFSFTAVCLACLASRLLVRTVDDPPLADLAALAIGAGILFVTVPFLWIALGAGAPAGPFTHRPVEASPDASGWDTFLHSIEPWL